MGDVCRVSQVPSSPSPALSIWTEN